MKCIKIIYSALFHCFYLIIVKSEKKNILFLLLFYIWFYISIFYYVVHLLKAKYLRQL